MITSQYFLYNLNIFTKFTDFSVHGLHFDLAVHQHVDDSFEREKFTSGSDKVAFSNEMIFSMPFEATHGKLTKNVGADVLLFCFRFLLRTSKIPAELCKFRSDFLLASKSTTMEI